MVIFRCPLWSDDRVLNAKAVIQVAEDVKKQLLKNNPNLKIDTDSLLPKVPAKTKGPHDDIPNANQLPVSGVIVFCKQVSTFL